MRDEYRRAVVVTMVLLGIFYLTMWFGLGFVLDDNVAGLLAATATWSLPVLLGTQTSCPIRLRYRYGFRSGSGYAGAMMVFQSASLIVGAKPHVFIPIVAVILMLPALAITMLLGRVLLTDEEHRAIKSRNSRRYQIP